jgi:hypothetical protein
VTVNCSLAMWTTVAKVKHQSLPRQCFSIIASFTAKSTQQSLRILSKIGQPSRQTPGNCSLASILLCPVLPSRSRPAQRPAAHDLGISGKMRWLLLSRLTNLPCNGAHTAALHMRHGGAASTQAAPPPISKLDLKSDECSKMPRTQGNQASRSSMCTCPCAHPFSAVSDHWARSIPPRTVQVKPCTFVRQDSAHLYGRTRDIWTGPGPRTQDDRTSGQAPI